MITLPIDSPVGIIIFCLMVLFLASGSAYFIYSVIYTKHALKRDMADEERKDYHIETMEALAYRRGKSFSSEVARSADQFIIVTSDDNGICDGSHSYKKGGEVYDLAEFLYHHGGIALVQEYWSLLPAYGVFVPLFFKDTDKSEWITHMFGNESRTGWAEVHYEWKIYCEQKG